MNENRTKTPAVVKPQSGLIGNYQRSHATKNLLANKFASK